MKDNRTKVAVAEPVMASSLEEAAPTGTPIQKKTY